MQYFTLKINTQLLTNKNASRRPFAMSIFWTIISSAYKKQKTFDQQTPTAPPNKKPEIYSRNQGPCLLFFPSFIYISPDIERHRFIFATWGIDYEVNKKIIVLKPTSKTPEVGWPHCWRCLRCYFQGVSSRPCLTQSCSQRLYLVTIVAWMIFGW